MSNSTLIADYDLVPRNPLDRTISYQNQMNNEHYVTECIPNNFFSGGHQSPFCGASDINVLDF